MVYRFKEGSRYAGPAQVVGEALEAIRRRDRIITPQAVVDDARPVASPLHRYFDWDPDSAANAWRVHQARGLIHSVEVEIVVEPGRPPTTEIGYVSVEIKDVGKGYVGTVEVVSDDELRRQMLADAVSVLNGWRKRFARLGELEEVFAAIDRLNERLDTDET